MTKVEFDNMLLNFLETQTYFYNMHDIFDDNGRYEDWLCIGAGLAKVQTDLLKVQILFHQLEKSQKFRENIEKNSG